jgi:hypothetical protein
MAGLRSKDRQACLELLIEISQGNDWELRAQVTLWITIGSIFLRISETTHDYIRKSCEVVNAARLQFIPTYGKPPDFSEELHEKLSVLSQIIYFENFLFLTCGGAEPTMSTRIEMEFRDQLRVRPAASLFTSRIQHSLRKYIRCCSTYVRWPCARKLFCWSETRYSYSAFVRLTVGIVSVCSYHTDR